MYTAITGDIIASRKIDLLDRDEVNNKLISDFKSLNDVFDVKYPFEFLRGDSFQGVLANHSDALKIALLIKCIFKKNLKHGAYSIAGKKSNVVNRNDERRNWRIYKNLDVRLSIGIGEIEYLKDDLSLSDGKALQYSGRGLENMKSKGQKLAITTNNKEIDRELDVELKLMDAIIDKWTPLSAEVVYYLLQGNNETKTSEILKISQSAINQRKSTANWDAIEIMLKNYKILIERL